MDVLFRVFNSFSRIPKKHGQRISRNGIRSTVLWYQKLRTALLVYKICYYQCCGYCRYPGRKKALTSLAGFFIKPHSHPNGFY